MNSDSEQIGNKKTIIGRPCSLCGIITTIIIITIIVMIALYNESDETFFPESMPFVSVCWCLGRLKCREKTCDEEDK